MSGGNGHIFPLFLFLQLHFKLDEGIFIRTLVDPTDLSDGSRFGAH